MSAKVRKVRAGSVARHLSDASDTPVRSRFSVCRLDSSAKAETSLTFKEKTKKTVDYG